jgi:hypothetical protein
MSRTGKKIGRNEPCHCGSGKKYKHYHLALDEQERAATRPAPPAPNPAPDPVDIAKIPAMLKTLSRTGPARDRAEFADLQAMIGPVLAFVENQEEIEAASTELEAHRAEFEQLLADPQAYMDRALALFKDERFAPMRATVADIRRAFDQVGYPANTASDERTIETLCAAILHLADKNRRTRYSTELLLHLPAFVTAGRYLDGWIIQQCADQTGEIEDKPNPFLLAMFYHGYDAWVAEKRAETDSTLRTMGLDPERLPTMKLDELDAWVQAQGADPAQTAKMEALMQQHPELRSEAIANLEAMERDSARLLDQPDAASLHLSPAEFGPWLKTLNEHLLEALKKEAIEPETTLTPALASQLLENVMLPVLREMAQAIFTPARIQQLIGQIREYRKQQFAAGNKTMAACALGAITSLEREDEPRLNNFLISLCYVTLKPEIGQEPVPAAEAGEV